MLAGVSISLPTKSITLIKPSRSFNLLPMEVGMQITFALPTYFDYIVLRMLNKNKCKKKSFEMTKWTKGETPFGPSTLILMAAAISPAVSLLWQY